MARAEVQESERQQRVTPAMVERAGKAVSDLLHRAAGESTIRSDVEMNVMELRAGQVSIEAIVRVALRAALTEAHPREETTG